MKVVLTGSTGFMGARVLYHLQSAGFEVICIPSHELRGEIDKERLARLTDFIGGSGAGVIVHTAAISSTAYSERHPDESRTANVELPAAMARIAVTAGCKLISCSSDQVYNSCGGIFPVSETDRLPEPSNVYGRHKLEAEGRISEICPDSVSLRLSWMYDLPLFGSRTNGNLVYTLLKAALTGSTKQYSAADFRGVTYVRSVARLLPGTFSLPGGVYNFGSPNDTHMYDTARFFLEAMGLEARIPELIKPADAAAKNLLMDPAKLRAAGICFESTREGIKNLVADYPDFFPA